MTLADYRPHPPRVFSARCGPVFATICAEKLLFRVQTFGGRSIQRTPRCVNASRASSPVVHDPLQKLLANAWHTSTSDRQPSNQRNRIVASALISRCLLLWRMQETHRSSQHIPCAHRGHRRLFHSSPCGKNQSLVRCNMLQWVHQKRSAELSCIMSSVK